MCVLLSVLYLGSGNLALHSNLYIHPLKSSQCIHLNASTSQKRTWDQWHRSFGHIAIPSLERLNRENMVNGLAIDQSSIPSKSCDACIQAKQARKSYPQEAESRSQTPGERVMSHQEIVKIHIRHYEPPKCIVDGRLRYELVTIL